MSFTEKSHLTKLPNTKPSDRPPRFTESSKRGLVLIPLYDGYHTRNEVDRGLGISAIWARRSWMLLSDAAKYGIEVKFYVENRIAGSVMSLFQRNGICGDDIIWFDGDQIEGASPKDGAYSTYGAKKLMLCMDDRFVDYEWVFCVDADLFVVSPSGEKLPFFEGFFGMMWGKPYLPAFWYARMLTNEQGHSPREFGYYRDADGGTTDASIEAFEERVDALLGSSEVTKRLKNDLQFLTVSGVITAFPARHFMSIRPDDSEFFVKGAEAVASGELPFVLWSMATGESLHDLTPLPFPMLSVATGMPVDHYESFVEASESGNPFLLHYATSPIDKIWAEGIGVLCE